MASLQPYFTRLNYCLIGISSIGLIGLCNACANFSQAEAESEIVAPEPIPLTNVVAFGRLAPKGEIISLSVPNAEDSRVNKMMVAEGNWVEANQVIAILQGIDRKERDLEEARRNVELQRAKLKKTKSGDFKEAEIAAQQANIERLNAQLRYETIEREAALASTKAELEQARITYQRNVSLTRQGAISQDELDKAQERLAIIEARLNQREAELNNTIQTTEKQIAQEIKNLARLREVRPVDIEIAEAELELAKVAVEQRKADLEDTKVRVPVAGRILRINTRVGERVDTEKGIIELGQTNQMYAIAEIYETEITKIKLGQKATIVSEYGGFEGEIIGKVAHVGLQVGKRTLTGDAADPTNDENTRVVEVKIRINDQYTQKVAALTNMQVRVSIDTERSN